jgi:hypothetical protein
MLDLGLEALGGGCGWGGGGGESGSGVEVGPKLWRLHGRGA